MLTINNEINLNEKFIIIVFIFMKLLISHEAETLLDSVSAHGSSFTR